MRCRIAVVTLIILVVLSLGCIVGECDTLGYSDVNTERVKELLSGDLRDRLVLLDVRQPDEYEESHIEGAVLIPLGELEGRLSEIDQSKSVLVICWSGFRSARAASVLVAAGFDDVELRWRHELVGRTGSDRECPWPARILTATGEVSVRRSSESDWEPVSELPMFLYGLDMVRTGAESGATIQLADGTTVVLEESSVMEME